MADNPVLKVLRNNLRQALQGGSLADAEQILARLKKEDPLSRETRGLELEFHLNSNRLEEASALAKQLCNIFPDSGRIHFLAGKVAYRLKHYPEAESSFRESHRVFPHWQALHWLGKTLTQTGRYDEAEALLLSAREHASSGLLDLAWLYERKNDLEAALQKIEEYLADHPGDKYATGQHLRLKAKMLEPEALIEEIEALAEHGAKLSDDLFLEYVERLFATGQTLRARDEVNRRTVALDEKPGVRLAWICYRARAYDLSCALFLNYLPGLNLINYKYLAALESAARRCKRLPQVLEVYRSLAGQAPHLHGRIKALRK